MPKFSPGSTWCSFFSHQAGTREFSFYKRSNLGYSGTRIRASKSTDRRIHSPTVSGRETVARLLVSGASTVPPPESPTLGMAGL